MSLVSCIVIDILEKNQKRYYRVQELNSDETHLVPFSQVEGQELAPDEIYTFFKEYNSKSSKTYLSIIHPDFQLNKEYTFKIEKIIEARERYFLVLETPFKKPVQVRAFPWQLDAMKVHCEVAGYKWGLPVIKNLESEDPNYKIWESYYFEIRGFGSFKDKKGKEINSIIVQSKYKNEIQVRASQWHTGKLWKYKDIKCQVIGFDRDAIPKLRVTDNRHPFFNIGEIHCFEVIGFKDKLTKDYSSIKIILLKGEHNGQHEVIALPNQENKLEKGDLIECSIENIDSKLRLKQVNIADPFFASFEKIINDLNLDSSYGNKYFNPIINNESENEQQLLLVQQYDSESAFWIFTYCNQVLPSLFYDRIYRRNYVEAIEINNLLIAFEEWILKKGIIRALPDENSRKRTKLKVEEVLARRKIIKDVLPKIDYQYHSEFYMEQENSFSFQKLYYFIAFTDLKLLDVNKMLDLLEFNQDLNFNKDEEFFAKRIGEKINKRKKYFLQDNVLDYFILRLYDRQRKSDLNLYLLWTYFEFLIYSILNENQWCNLIAASLFRYHAFMPDSSFDKSIFLYNAYYILLHLDQKHSLPIYRENENILIKENELEANPNLNENSSSWNDILQSVENKTPLKVQVTEKYYEGFKLEYYGIPGFLPIHNIKDPALKFYNLDEIKWSTNVEAHLYSENFNFFVAKQLDQNNPLFYSENLNSRDLPNEGTIIKVVVNAITEYGVFVRTKFGDGLIHTKNIEHESDWNIESLNSVFNVGDQLFAVIILVKDNKLDLGFKHLIGTEYENFYFDYFIKDNDLGLNLGEEDSERVDEIGKLVELEKGFIFEQYAIIHEDIATKINYIKFAKQFFANTANARSYLLNIYIEYFKSIQELNNVIENYSFERYNDFKKRIVSTKDRIQPKTLENFPETENLIFFIEILDLFNDTTLNGYRLLFKYIERYSSDDKKKLLNVLAKTTLANNLLISEVEELSDTKKEVLSYSLSNLKRIRDYIKNGVFSLAESKEDRITRELNEKRNYWYKRIRQDESEHLEFKSSFIVPIPDDEKLKIIASLEKKKNKITNLKDRKGIEVRIDELKGLTAQKKIMHSAFKTIAAFANTKGGHLLIGVTDDKDIFGLERDYSSFNKPKDQNRDGFGKFFDSALKEYFGNSFSSLLLNKEYIQFPEGDVLVVEVKPSSEEVFLLRDESGKKSEELYVRNLSSSDKLEGLELAKFIREKFRNRISQE